MSKSRSVRLFDLGTAGLVLPILAFEVGEIPSFVASPEFRVFIRELLAQVFTGIADAVIVTLVNLSFGVA